MRSEREIREALRLLIKSQEAMQGAKESGQVPDDQMSRVMMVILTNEMLAQCLRWVLKNGGHPFAALLGNLNIYTAGTDD